MCLQDAKIFVDDVLGVRLDNAERIEKRANKIYEMVTTLFKYRATGIKGHWGIKICDSPES